MSEYKPPDGYESQWCCGDECLATVPPDGLAAGWTVWSQEGRVGILCPLCSAFWAREADIALLSETTAAILETCPHRLGTGVCTFGCHDEPRCGEARGDGFISPSEAWRAGLLAGRSDAAFDRQTTVEAIIAALRPGNFHPSEYDGAEALTEAWYRKIAERTVIALAPTPAGDGR